MLPRRYLDHHDSTDREWSGEKKNHSVPIWEGVDVITQGGRWPAITSFWLTQYSCCWGKRPTLSLEETQTFKRQYALTPNKTIYEWFLNGYNENVHNNSLCYKNLRKLIQIGHIINQPPPKKNDLRNIFFLPVLLPFSIGNEEHWLHKMILLEWEKQILS